MYICRLFISKYFLLSFEGMYIKNSLPFIVCLISMSLIAQPSNQPLVTLSGTVLDAETNQPLEYATLVLRNLRNPEAITGGITDANGNFRIETPAGRYDIRAEYISYKAYELKNQLLQGFVNLGAIRLQLDVAQLKEVELVGERTTVELRLDKKVYNVGQDLTVRGGTVTDVLDNIPSVTVGVEGNIALRGNENVRILINGKPSALSGLNPETLQQLPADAIEKVEVITNPSARYDAEGTAGIINIILKQNKIAGINGSLNLYTGYPANYGAALSLNLRSDNFNLFNNTTYNYRQSPGNALFEQENFDDTGATIGFQNEYRKYHRQNDGFTHNLGFELFLDKTTSVTSSFVYRKATGDNETDVDFYNFDALGAPSIQRKRFTGENQQDESVQYGLNFTKKFKKDGHTFTMDYQYSKSGDTRGSLIEERVLGESTFIPSEHTSTDERQKNQLVQMDYVLPFGKDNSGQFELGYRGTFNVFTNNFGLAVQDEYLNFVTDADYSNYFIYKEYVNAFYTQAGNRFGKFNLLGGLRMEASDVGIELRATGTVTQKDYIDWFPSLSIGYEFSDTEQFTGSYSRRLRRPMSRFINPFPARSSNTNLFQGNPDLNPAYTNVIDLGYLKRWKQITLNTSAYYNRSTGVIQLITLETGEFVEIDNPDFDDSLPPDPITNPQNILIPVQARSPINLATENRYGVEFITTYTPIKNWRFTWTLNVFNQEVRGDYNYTNFEGETIRQNFDADNFSWFVRASAKIPMPSKIDFQTNLVFDGPTKDAQNRNKSIFSANLAASKDLFKDKATLSLNITDVLNSRKRRTNSLTGVAETYSEFQWRERQVTVSLLFRFNRQKEERQQRRRGNDDGFEFEG
jgi:outer membrane receptor protein involved in Fe transport